MEIRVTCSPVLQRKVFGILVLLSLLSKDTSSTFLIGGSPRALQGIASVCRAPLRRWPLFVYRGEVVF